MAFTIFLSVGGQATESQHRYVEAFRAFLAEYDMHPVTAQAGLSSPFENIVSKMRMCDGVIVLAFERYFVPQLIENRGGTREDRAETVLRDVQLPTTWNQVEAAFAAAWEMPLLVMRERGLRDDGLIDRGGKWHVHPIDVSVPDFEGLRVAVGDLAEAMAKSKRPLARTLKRVGMAGRIGLLGSFIGSAAVAAGAAFSIGRWMAG